MEEQGWNLDLIHRVATVIIPTLVLSITQLVKKFVAFVPNEWLPIVSLFVGAVLAAVGEVFSVPGLDGQSVANGAMLGAGATGLHQVVVQRRIARGGG